MELFFCNLDLKQPTFNDAQSCATFATATIYTRPLGPPILQSSRGGPESADYDPLYHSHYFLWVHDAPVHS